MRKLPSTAVSLGAVVALALALWPAGWARADEATRPRLRDLGIAVGELPAGPLDAITDVAGVAVGHTTIREGDSIRTGVTAILPHGGNVFRDKVPAAFACMNGYGKPVGTVQIRELGEIETPILLGSTLSVSRIADAVIDYVLSLPGNEDVLSVNPVVGETNDGFLSDGRARPVKAAHVLDAIRSASGGPVAEGAVGAGTGTRCLGYKGGIGTASRIVRPADRTDSSASEHVVGVLVQTNFGGSLRILGRSIDAPSDREPAAGGDSGSCAIVVATDAPLDSRQLERLARRSFAGMARAGASFSHGSGDYAFAFSTARDPARVLPDAALSPFFIAVADATEEAIYNSLLKARTVRGRLGREVPALPLDRVRAALAFTATEPGKMSAAAGEDQDQGDSDADGAGEQTPLLAGDFRWTAIGPLIAPADAAGGEHISVKDPSVIFFEGRWHLFVTVRGKKRSHRIEHLSFADWEGADKAERRFLECHDGFFCAPQVFFFAPRKLWYLICQASDESWNPKYGAAFTTTSDLADPASWRPLAPLGHRFAGEKAGLDFWVIADDETAHLFFTTLDGRMWREETSLEEFPHGWSEPVLALEGDIFEASHIYRIAGTDRYLAVIEAQGGRGWRNFRAYIADRLDGEWRPLAATRDDAFASLENTRFAGERWTDSISHGELIRKGWDQRLEIDPSDLRFVFQGVLDSDRRGKSYGEIPWRLGMLRSAAGGEAKPGN